MYSLLPFGRKHQNLKWWFGAFFICNNTTYYLIMAAVFYLWLRYKYIFIYREVGLNKDGIIINKKYIHNNIINQYSQRIHACIIQVDVIDRQTDSKLCSFQVVINLLISERGQNSKREIRVLTRFQGFEIIITNK